MGVCVGFVWKLSYIHVKVSNNWKRTRRQPLFSSPEEDEGPCRHQCKKKESNKNCKHNSIAIFTLLKLLRGSSIYGLGYILL